MTKRTRREPIFVTLADGSELVHVPLLKGRDARVNRADFDRLMTYGLSDQWIMNGAHGNEYVRSSLRCPMRGKWPLVVVARMILRPGPFQRVRYRNGDRTDLRRWNLEVVSGSGTGREDRYMSEIEDAALAYAGAH